MLVPLHDIRLEGAKHDSEGVIGCSLVSFTLANLHSVGLFKILTEHGALPWILNMTYAKGKLERWNLRLLEIY